MKSPYYFLVIPKGGKRYDNQRGELYISTSKEDHRVTTREAVVISTPINYTGPIEPGDTIVCHHNTFRIYYDMRGREKSAWNYFRDDLFFIDDPYAYKKPGGEWKGIGRYLFIKPIDNDFEGVTSADAKKPLTGTIRYTNDEILDLGVKEGDTVTFEPESEYEFDLDGEILYRMYTKNVTIKLNE
jgi:hypothetical protein